VIADCAASGYDYLRGCFVDRIAADCGFPAVQAGFPIREQFPLGGFVSNSILGADPRKVVAVRGNLPVLRGQHHAAAGRACPTRLYYIPVHHFKWTAGIASRLAERAETLRRRGSPHWTESAQFVDYHRKSGGRLNAADPNLYIAPAEPEYRHWEGNNSLDSPELRVYS
jgi:hypothetical protein